MGLIETSILVFAALQQATVVATNEENMVSAVDLVNLSDVGGHANGAINISPDGRWVVFQLQTPTVPEGDYKLIWMAASAHDRKVSVIADGGDVLLNPTLGSSVNGNLPPAKVAWSPDSKSFVYLLRRNGQTQLWRSRPDRKGQVQLTRRERDVIEFVWDPDGSKLYFTGGLDKSEVVSHRETEGARGFFYDDRFVPYRSTEPIMRVCGNYYGRPNMEGLARACEPALWVYDYETGAERLATEEEKRSFKRLRDNIHPPAVIADRPIKRLRSANGISYAWLENTDPKNYRGPYAPLTLFALFDGELRRCDVDVCRAYQVRGHQDMWWTENGKEVVFLRRDGPSHSKSGLYAWSLVSGGVRQIVQSDDWLSECAPAGDSLICLYETWEQPRKIVSVSLKDGAIKTLYDPNPDFASHRFPKIEKLVWEDDYGNSTYGHLVYPVDYQPGKAYPLVIVTYQSRGFLRGGSGNEYPIFPLSAEGFFVLSQEMPFDTELAAKSADYMSKLYGTGYLRKSVLSSQAAIVNRLANAGLIDQSRIAITGFSEGQSQVNYALIHSDIFAVAIASGSFNSSSAYYLGGDVAREYQRSIWGEPEDHDSLEFRLSVGLNAGRISAPLLINVSDQEFLGAVENVARLKDAGKPVEMYVFPGEHHFKWRPDHRLAVYRRNIQWLKFWLKGETEESPISTGQYERWGKLCKLHAQSHNNSNRAPLPCVDYGESGRLKN